MLNGKSILVTGGTGSFGKEFCRQVLEQYNPERLIVYSRDEFKQYQMGKEEIFQHPAMRFFLGDVRDQLRLTRAMSGVDIVVHAAALKQVPAAEYNPHEFIKTNINGAMNVVEAALDAGVERVLALSTDKAVNPLNLYGATKLCSDKIFVAANSYRGKNNTKFSVVRYGNVIGSRGSVIPHFLENGPKGILTVTAEEMTRFFITIKEGAQFVLDRLEHMNGGELYIPKLPSCNILDLAKIIAPEAEIKIIGIRPGEKMHEVLIPEDECYLTLDCDKYYLIQPTLSFWKKEPIRNGKYVKEVPQGFSYASNTNDWWLTEEEIFTLASKIADELNLPQPGAIQALAA